MAATLVERLGRKNIELSPSVASRKSENMLSIEQKGLRSLHM